MANYIKDIRSKVGHMPIFLNAVAGAVVNDQGQILLQQRTDAGNWSLPGGMMEYGETFVTLIGFWCVPLKSRYTLLSRVLPRIQMAIRPRLSADYIW